MKDYSYHKKVIADVIEKLREQDIDLYLIITAEGCDPMTEFIPGVDTVGASAYLFAKDGTKWATASNIDAQDVEESELFDKVVRYQDYDQTLAQMVLELKPKKIALDYSEDNALPTSSITPSTDMAFAAALSSAASPGRPGPDVGSEHDASMAMAIKTANVLFRYSLIRTSFCSECRPGDKAYPEPRILRDSLGEDIHAPCLGGEDIRHREARLDIEIREFECPPYDCLGKEHEPVLRRFQPPEDAKADKGYGRKEAVPIEWIDRDNQASLREIKLMAE